MVDEYKACADKFIKNVNGGVVNMRLRGAKRDSIVSILAAERQRVVQLVQREGVRAKTPMHAIEAEVFEQRNAGKDLSKYKTDMVRIAGKGFET